MQVLAPFVFMLLTQGLSSSKTCGHKNSFNDFNWPPCSQIACAYVFCEVKPAFVCARKGIGIVHITVAQLYPLLYDNSI